MTLQELFVEFTKENITIRKINLGQDLIWKGECLYTNKKCIVFINSNITDADILKCLLTDILNHIKYNNNS